MKPCHWLFQERKPLIKVKVQLKGDLVNYQFMVSAIDGDVNGGGGALISSGSRFG